MLRDEHIEVENVNHERARDTIVRAMSEAPTLFNAITTAAAVVSDEVIVRLLVHTTHAEQLTNHPRSSVAFGEAVSPQ